MEKTAGRTHLASSLNLAICSYLYMIYTNDFGGRIICKKKNWNQKIKVNTNVFCSVKAKPPFISTYFSLLYSNWMHN